MRQLDGIINSTDMSFSEGQGSLTQFSPWGSKESDTTDQLNNNGLFTLLPHLLPDSINEASIQTLIGWYLVLQGTSPPLSPSPSFSEESCYSLLQHLFSYWPVVRQAGEGNGNPLQYFCLENPVVRGAWWAAVHRVTQSRTRLKRLSMYACIGEGSNPLQCSCLENPRDREACWPSLHPSFLSQQMPFFITILCLVQYTSLSSTLTLKLPKASQLDCPQLTGFI